MHRFPSPLRRLLGIATLLGCVGSVQAGLISNGGFEAKPDPTQGWSLSGNTLVRLLRRRGAAGRRRRRLLWRIARRSDLVVADPQHHGGRQLRADLLVAERRRRQRGSAELLRAELGRRRRRAAAQQRRGLRLPALPLRVHRQLLADRAALRLRQLRLVLGLRRGGRASHPAALQPGAAGPGPAGRRLARRPAALATRCSPRAGSAPPAA